MYKWIAIDKKLLIDKNIRLDKMLRVKISFKAEYPRLGNYIEQIGS